MANQIMISFRADNQVKDLIELMKKSGKVGELDPDRHDWRRRSLGSSRNYGTSNADVIRIAILRMAKEMGIPLDFMERLAWERGEK